MTQAALIGDMVASGAWSGQAAGHYRRRHRAPLRCRLHRDNYNWVWDAFDAWCVTEQFAALPAHRGAVTFHRITLALPPAGADWKQPAR